MFSHSDFPQSIAIFAMRELSAPGLSTDRSGVAYNGGMSRALKSYLDAERGRASRLADDLGVSRSYISDLANGKKDGSVVLFRRIAQVTGIAVADLMGDQRGMSEGDATPYVPATKSNQMRDMVGMLALGTRHPSYFTAKTEHQSFGILPGDLLIAEASFNAEKIEPERLVIADVAHNFGEGKTIIARIARPWLIDSSGRICGELAITAGILGVIQIVVRSADPAAY